MCTDYLRNGLPITWASNVDKILLCSALIAQEHLLHYPKLVDHEFYPLGLEFNLSFWVTEPFWAIPARICKNVITCDLLWRVSESFFDLISFQFLQERTFYFWLRLSGRLLGGWFFGLFWNGLISLHQLSARYFLGFLHQGFGYYLARIDGVFLFFKIRRKIWIFLGWQDF